MYTLMLIYNQSTGGGVIVEKMKMGRPTLNETPRNKRLSIKVTSEELERIQKVCIENNLRYRDIVLKGLEYWSKKQ